MNFLINMYKEDSQKIVVIIEARMTSSRLPGKVLMPLAGKPSLERQIERLKRSKFVDEVLVATTVNSADDPIEELTREVGASCYRGSELDVLGRVVDAAKSVNADIIVEITGDCPLADWRMVDKGIEEFFENKVDYASNALVPFLPDGFGIQIYPTKVLVEVEKLTKDPIDRAHVTSYIYNHPKKYRLYNWLDGINCHGPDLRVTLDEEDDYQLLDLIFTKLLPVDEDFSATAVVDLLRNNPELKKINEHIKAKELHEG